MFLVPPPATAYDAAPSRAITAPSASARSVSFDIPTSIPLVMTGRAPVLGPSSRPTRGSGGRFSGDGELVQVRLEHRLDLRGTRAAVDARDRLAVLHEDERRHDGDEEALGDLGARVDVDAADAQALPLLPLEMGQEALHSPSRSRPLGPEED